MFEFTLYWIIPYITWHYLNIRITLIADHCFAYNDKTYKSRTVILSLFEQIFMVPHALNYHNEHHLFGDVPCYNLKKLHKKLMLNETYRRQACVANGYLDVLRQVSI